jgi:hypothetical protein
MITRLTKLWDSWASPAVFLQSTCVIDEHATGTNRWCHSQVHATSSLHFRYIILAS